MRRFSRIILLYLAILSHCDVYATNSDIFVTQNPLGSRAIESGGKAIDPNTGITIINPPPRVLFFPVGNGTVTGLTNTGDTYWVQNLRYSENGKLMIDVCRSYVVFLWVQESCVAVETEQTVGTSFGGIYSKKVSVKTESFDYFNPGLSSNQGSNHKSGYVFNLYSSKCPYKLAASKESKCELFASDKIEGFYSNNIDYSMHNNCYLMYKQLSSACPDPSGCVCQESNGNCGVNNYFMPTSAFLQTKDNDTKKCYKCHANYRKALSDCLNASFNNTSGSGFGVDSSNKFIYNNNLNNQELYNKFHKNYGLGGYLCGYVDDIRAGCIKIQIPPSRPLPRIAMILDKGYQGAREEPFKHYPAANLFESDLRVDKFDNETEVGEHYRGNFFKPKIKLAYGANTRVVEFKLKDNAYLTYVVDENDRSYSSWSENYPGVMEYGVFDKHQNVIIDKTDVAYYCTRVEYDKERNIETYAAYVVKDPDSIYDRSVRLGEYVDTTRGLTCQSLYQTEYLKKIGYSNRPTLKYTYKNGSVSSPIKIIISGSTDKVIKALVKIYPDLSPSADTLSSSFKQSIVSESLPLSTFLMAVPSDSTADYRVFMQGYNTKCGYLLNKKICIDYNICDTMRQIPSGIRLGTESCSSDRCKIALDTFDKIKNYCMLNTNCDSSDGDLTTCIGKKPSYQKMNLTGVTAEYDNRYQWRPEVCISEGFEEANFEKGGNVDLYGSFGDLNKYNNMIVSFDDTDIDIRYKDIYKIFKLPMRDISSKSEKNLETKNIINLSLNTSKADGYFTSTSTNNARESLLEMIKSHNSSLVNHYNTIGCDDACFANSLTARTRNARELGMCAEYYNNFIYKYGGYSKVSAGSDALIESTTPSGIEYKHYIPLKCDAMEARVFGGGGSGNTFNYHERLDYRFHVVINCAGLSAWATLKTAFCWLYGGCDEIDEMWADVNYQCNKKLFNGGGGGGGYSHGIIDTKSFSDNVLRVYQVFGHDIKNDYQSYIKASNVNVLTATRGSSKGRDEMGTYGGFGGYNASYLNQSGYGGNAVDFGITDVGNMPVEPTRPRTPDYDIARQNESQNVCTKIRNSIGVCSEKYTVTYDSGLNSLYSVSNSHRTNSAYEIQRQCMALNFNYESDKRLCAQTYSRNRSGSSNCLDYESDKSNCPQTYSNNTDSSPDTMTGCNSTWDSDPGSNYYTKFTGSYQNDSFAISPYVSFFENNVSYNLKSIDICCPISQACLDQEIEHSRYDNEMKNYNIQMQNYQILLSDRMRSILNNINQIRSKQDQVMNSFFPIFWTGDNGSYGPLNGWSGEQGVNDNVYNGYRNSYAGGSNMFKNYFFIDNKWQRVDNNQDYNMSGNDCNVASFVSTATTIPSWFIRTEGRSHSDSIKLTNNDFKSTAIANYKYASGGCSSDTGWDVNFDISKNIFGSDSHGMTTLTCPMIKYDLSTMKPLIRSGNKVLYDIVRDQNSYDIVRDPDCIAKCPPAYIRTKDNQYICEYSSLDPSNGYETKTDTTVYPAKCFGNDGKIYSPMTNLCYSTKCTPGGLGARFSQYCGNENIYNVKRFFMITASFGSDRVSDAENNQYCDKSINVTYNNDLMKYSMYCNENGVWQYPDKMQFGDNDNYFIKTFYNTNKLAVFERPNAIGSNYQCSNTFGWPRPC
jgi:hypothetical protein